MTAAVLGGVGQKLQIDEVELAPPRDGEVLVKVAASGLCASDLNAIDGKRTLAPFPLVPGHEAAGVVVQTGPGVTRLKAGDAVVIQQAWSSLDVGGEAVVVGLMPHGATVTLSAGRFVDEQVTRGCYFGSAYLQRDVPALTGHYLAGDLLLDELITRRIGLDELNDAFDALRGGKGARSVLVLD